MSRAVRFNSFGAIDQLGVAEVDESRPGPGKVRVAVRRPGLNPVDLALLRLVGSGAGAVTLMRSVSSPRPSNPLC